MATHAGFESVNRDGFARGLCGPYTQVHHLHEDRKVIAFYRLDKGGPGDNVVVVAHFRHEAQDDYVIGFPAAGPRLAPTPPGYHGGI